MNTNPNEFTDIELIDTFKEKREDKYFEILVKRHKKLIEGKATQFYSNNKMYVDYYDLSQEAFIAFYKAIFSYDPEKEAAFSTYASTCINNALINFIKHEKKNSFKNITNEIIEDFSYENSSNIEFDQPLPDNDIKDELDELLSTLEENERNLLIYRLQGKSYKEIADALHIKPKDVDNTYQKIKNKLRSKR